MDADRILRRGPIEVDLDRWRVSVLSKVVPVSPLQFRVLAQLMRRPGRVFSRQELLQAAWEQSAFDRRPESVDVVIARLRSTLGASGKAITTVRGVGYSFSG